MSHGNYDVPTIAIHGGLGPDPTTGAILQPICQCTTFVQQAVGVHKGFTYSRAANPTVDALEHALAALEGTAATVCFATGMAAITTLFLSLLKSGDHVVISEVVYGGTVRLCQQLLTGLGIEHTLVDASRAELVEKAITPRTKLIFIETPGNPTLKLCDIPAIAAVARRHGVRLAVDNTFLTPVLQPVFQLGADISVLSTTKYIEGHNATVGGSLATHDEQLLERFRLIRKTTGCIQSPQDAWLTQRGIKTLPVRMKLHSENASIVAQWLESHPAVERVYYPGLASFPQKALAERQHLAHGGMLAFEITAGAEAAVELMNSVRLCSLAENLGAVETLITHPVSMTHGDVPTEIRKKIGITDGLIRLSVGLESPEDIIADLEQALAIATEKAGEGVMRHYPITVLKFGSSVLCCEADLCKAVQEIYHWTRDGHRVVAVVSAIGSTTDGLLARAQAYGSGLSDQAVATLVATGEATSAALLTLALERSGIKAAVVDEVRLGLRTRGPVLNAEPCGIDVPRMLSTLENTSVAVVPGFVGRQEDGTLSLLGRGGSDLTAVFVAHHLGAERCRLIKDVNGIFEHDPADTINAPRRYSTVTWTQAVRVGNGVVQPRAMEFAEQHGLSIEVATLNSDSPTLICGLPISFADESPSVTPLRVGLLGAGTVGLGVYRTLAVHPETFDVRQVAVRRLDRDDEIPADLLTHDPWEVVNSDCEVIIELIGGLSPARELIEAALKSGKHVITANKLVVSRHGKQLRRIADFAGVQFLYSAAVGGGVPMLEQVGRVAQSSGIRALHGVVNGTTNFILDRLAEGLSREAALAEAQRLGFAEQDPTSDLDGSDAAHKLALLAQMAFGAWLNPAGIERTGIEQFDSDSVQDAARSGHSVRLVATLSQDKFGVRAQIAPQLVAQTHSFAQTINEENCLEIVSQSGDVVQVRGKGAGRWPTAVSVMADVCDVYRASQLNVADECFVAGRAS